MEGRAFRSLKKLAVPVALTTLLLLGAVSLGIGWEEAPRDEVDRQARTWRVLSEESGRAASAFNGTNGTEAKAVLILPGAEVGAVIGPVGTIVLMLAAFLVFGGLCVCCGTTYVRTWKKGDWPTLGLCPPRMGEYIALGGGSAASARKSMGPRIRGEAVLALTIPWACFVIGLVVGWLAGGEAIGLPLVVAVTLVVVLRAKQVEVALMSNLNPAGDVPSTVSGVLLLETSEFLDDVRGCKVPAPRFAESTLEVADMASDGFALATAFYLAEEAQRRFIKAWSTGSAAFLLGPVAGWLHPVGMLLVSLAYATWCQGGVAQESDQAAAELAGMGLLANMLRIDTDEQDARNENLFVLVARVLCENAPQLTLQTSIMMATGKSLWSQPALLASVLLSLVTASKKTMQMVLLNVRDKNPIAASCISGLVFILPTWALLAYITAKLYFLEACPSHEWGLTTGCVAL